MTFKAGLAAVVLASLLSLAVTASAPGAVGVGERRALESDPAAAQRSARPATASPLIAPAADCPDQDDLGASAAAQEQAMLCMTNFARAQSGLAELGPAAELDQSAQAKAGDLLGCDEFSHTACGRDFTYWIRAAGFIGEGCWHAGENLAWGSGEEGSVRAIFRAWMASPTHRRNILGDYDQAGIALLTGTLEGRPGAHVWASHFGSRC